MPLWGAADQANNAPKFVVDAASGADGNAVFGNTTVDAFVVGQVVGLYGVDTTEAMVAGNGVSSGWNLVRRGTGFVSSLTIDDPGTGYTNGDLVVVEGGTVNAVATVATNGNGEITSVAITTPGAGFLEVGDANVSVTNSTGGSTTGSNADFSVTLGGRAGRVTVENLVFIKTMSGDFEDTEFPDS